MGSFGDRIRKQRRKRLLTVRALAQMVGRTPGYISRVETRGELPSAELICKLAAVLDAGVEELLAIARSDVIQRTESALAERHQEALRLFRRSK